MNHNSTLSSINSWFIRAFWWVRHLGRRCQKSYITTITGAWNKEYPDYITPKHTCDKCGREIMVGFVHPARPLPKPKPKQHE